MISTVLIAVRNSWIITGTSVITAIRIILMNTEKIFAAKVIRKLRTIPNLWAIKTHMPGIAGVPDIIGCYQGMFFALELKREKKARRSKLQVHVIKVINDCGGYAKFVWPEVWSEIFEEIQDL
jgi:hypothetical protein